MKKIVSLLLMLLSINMAFSNNKPIANRDKNVEEERQVSSYHSIDISGAYHIVFTEKETDKIKINAPEDVLSLIKTEVENNILKIGKEDDKHKAISKTTIYIPVNKKIKSIICRGAVNISNESTISIDNLELDMRGSGSVKLSLNTSSLKLDISGAAVVYLSGKTKDFFAEIKGAGNVKAQDFSSENAIIQIKGAGKATAHVTHSLEASIAGTGKINVTGSPTSQKKSIKGIGIINIE